MIDKELTMSWIKDGSIVRANYLDREITGLVMDSRVKYGGTVQYKIVLDTPLSLPWRSEPVKQVLIDGDEIVSYSKRYN